MRESMNCKNCSGVASPCDLRRMAYMTASLPVGEVKVRPLVLSDDFHSAGAAQLKYRPRWEEKCCACFCTCCFASLRSPATATPPMRQQDIISKSIKVRNLAIIHPSVACLVIGSLLCKTGIVFPKEKCDRLLFNFTPKKQLVPVLKTFTASG